MKNSAINTFKIANEYFNQNGKRDSILNINAKNKKRKNSDYSSFIKNISDQKKLMNETIDKVKLDNFKERLQLEDDKNRCIKDIKDYCNKYKDKLKGDMGISSQLDSILSGDVETVIRTMDYNEVDKHLSNLEYSIVHNSRNSLVEYYRKGEDKNGTYAQSIGDNTNMDIKKFLNSDTESQETKEHVELIEGVKYCYKNLYDSIDRLKKFKVESTERLKELKKNMESSIEKTMEQESKFNQIKSKF